MQPLSKNPSDPTNNNANLEFGTATPKALDLSICSLKSAEIMASALADREAESQVFVESFSNAPLKIGNAR